MKRDRLTPQCICNHQTNKVVPYNLIKLTPEESLPSAPLSR